MYHSLQQDLAKKMPDDFISMSEVLNWMLHSVIMPVFTDSESKCGDLECSPDEYPAVRGVALSAADESRLGCAEDCGLWSATTQLEMTFDVVDRATAGPLAGCDPAEVAMGKQFVG